MRHFIMLYWKEIKRIKSFIITLLIGYILGDLSIMLACILQNTQDYFALYLLFPLSWLLFPFILESSYKAERTQFTAHQLFSLPVRKHLIILSKHSAILSIYVVFLMVSYSLAKFTFQILYEYGLVWRLPLGYNLGSYYTAYNMNIAIFSFLLISIVTFIEPFRAVFKKYQNVLCSIVVVVFLIFIMELYPILHFYYRLEILSFGLYTLIVSSLLTFTAAVLYDKVGEV